VLKFIYEKSSDHGGNATADLPNHTDNPNTDGSESQPSVNHRENNVEPLPIKVLESVTGNNSSSGKTTSNPSLKLLIRFG